MKKDDSRSFCISEIRDCTKRGIRRGINVGAGLSCYYLNS